MSAWLEDMRWGLEEGCREAWWALLRLGLCSWRGHRPEEIGSTSWGFSMRQWTDWGETIVEPAIRTKQRHNTVICLRCRTILASADWNL